MHWALKDLPGPEKWFHHGEEILSLIEQQRPLTVVELGTYKGASAIAIGRVIQAWAGDIFTVEIDAGLINQARTNIKLAGLDNVIVMHPSESWHYGKIDCLYIDADHTEVSVTKDLETWWPHLSNGALVLGDDYDNPNFYGVTIAFDKWESLGHELHRGEKNPNSDPPNMRLIYGWKR